MAKKRKNGSGTLRKRSDGRWEARVVTGYDDNGNPKTKNVLAKTKAECLAKLEELKEKYAPPVTKCKPDMSFGDWLDFWYQNYCKPQLRLNTELGYKTLSKLLSHSFKRSCGSYLCAICFAALTSGVPHKAGHDGRLFSRRPYIGGSRG